MPEMTREEMQQEICNLIVKLGSSASDIGDWKVLKIYEARMKQEEDPYDFDELVAAREEVRAKINELQEKIDALDAEEE